MSEGGWWASVPQLGQDGCATRLRVADLIGPKAGDLRGGVRLEIRRQALGGELPQDPVEQPGCRCIIEPGLRQAGHLDQVFAAKLCPDVAAGFIQIGDTGFGDAYAPDTMTARAMECVECLQRLICSSSSGPNDRHGDKHSERRRYKQHTGSDSTGHRVTRSVTRRVACGLTVPPGVTVARPASRRGRGWWPRQSSRPGV